MYSCRRSLKFFITVVNIVTGIAAISRCLAFFNSGIVRVLSWYNLGFHVGTLIRRSRRAKITCSYRQSYNERYPRNTCKMLDIQENDIPWPPRLPHLATKCCGYVAYYENYSFLPIDMTTTKSMDYREQLVKSPGHFNVNIFLLLDHI